MAAWEDLLAVLCSLQEKPLLFAWRASPQCKGFLVGGFGAGKGLAFCPHCLPGCGEQERASVEDLALEVGAKLFLPL